MMQLCIFDIKESEYFSLTATIGELAGMIKDMMQFQLKQPKSGGIINSVKIGWWPVIIYLRMLCLNIDMSKRILMIVFSKYVIFITKCLCIYGNYIVLNMSTQNL